MGVCWWCYWGWPKPIKDIYDEALRRLGGNEIPLHYGPAHVVWEEENWDAVQRCLGQLDDWCCECSEEELAVVKWSLEELLKVDDSFKSVPESYDGHNPERFPPPAQWVMVR